jgi:4-amino-4-deoxy-L-arabinose transferase-like glycosyltransferase
MSRKFLLAIIVGAVLVRLVTFAWVATHGGEPILTEGDATTYVEMARHLAQGEGFVTTRDGTLVPELFRAPGMSLWVAPFMFFENGVFYWGIFLSLVAGILLPLCAYLLGTRLFDSRAGYISALLVAFEPHLVWFSWLLMSEMAATLLLLGAVTILTNEGKLSFARATGVGFLFGMLTLVRPPFFPILFTLLACSGFWLLWKQEKKEVLGVMVVALMLLLVTMPWSLRNQKITGHYALSGMGWYNVYFDYLSSLDAVHKGTSFAEEKEARIAAFHTAGTDGQELGITQVIFLKNAALTELWERRGEVVRLEPAFLFSYFTHDGYFQYARQLGFLPKPSGHAPSSTLLLLSQGIDAIPALWDVLKQQYLVPLLGRMFTAGIVVLALLSWWLHRSVPRVWLIAFLIALSAGIATAIGLGVEARSRVPMEPFLFVLAAGALSTLFSRYCDFFKTPARHSGA